MFWLLYHANKETTDASRRQYILPLQCLNTPQEGVIYVSRASRTTTASFPQQSRSFRNVGWFQRIRAEVAKHFKCPERKEYVDIAVIDINLKGQTNMTFKTNLLDI